MWTGLRSGCLGLVAFIGVSIVGLVVWHHFWSRPVEVSRYRLDVVVDTPNGVRTGSGVVGMYASKVLDLPSPTWSGSMDAQAIPIDLGRGRTLWMTVSHPAIRLETSAPWLGEYAMKTDRPNRIEEDMTPPFVVFGDERDPSTARAVDRRDLEATFGSGYSLRGVFVSRSSDGITRTAASRLPWAVDRLALLDGSLTGSVNVGDRDPRKYMSGEYFVRKPH